jgi:phenylpropionate dioxygenase-like ring-hydroxylating dioxygenase large terminal subunit
MIKNINYLDDEIFNIEMENLHNSSWVFVCLKEQISIVNDFVTYEIGKKSLVIQNFEGDIKCFENICQHRFNKIQSGHIGNAPFFCKYHSWGYDSKGNAIVSQDFTNQLIAENRNCLKQYEVEKIGEFVFAKVNQDSKVSLKEHLGEFYQVLLNLSSYFDKQIINEYTVISHRANWKLLVENVLECYHCVSVHKETLVPIGVGTKKPKNHVTDRFHDMIDYPIRIGNQQKIRNEKLSFLKKRSFEHGSLRHVFVFPNLFITSTDGILFYVGKLSPQSADKSDLLVSFVKPKLVDLTKKETVLSNAFFNSSLDSSTKVIFEDKEILENIQKNLPMVEGLAQIFGKEEFRVERFHDNIKKEVKYI